VQLTTVGCLVVLVNGIGVIVADPADPAAAFGIAEPEYLYSPIIRHAQTLFAVDVAVCAGAALTWPCKLIVLGMDLGFAAVLAVAHIVDPVGHSAEVKAPDVVVGFAKV
jgi:hypothetical protein